MTTSNHFKFIVLPKLCGKEPYNKNSVHKVYNKVTSSTKKTERKEPTCSKIIPIVCLDNLSEDDSKLYNVESPLDTSAFLCI